MGLLSALADAIYREYDRRIKRASVITEYGQHHGHSAGHAEAPHAADEHAAEDEADIVNIPRGTPVAPREHATNDLPETTEQH